MLHAPAQRLERADRQGVPVIGVVAHETHRARGLEHESRALTRPASLVRAPDHASSILVTPLAVLRSSGLFLPCSSARVPVIRHLTHWCNGTSSYGRGEWSGTTAATSCRPWLRYARTPPHLVTASTVWDPCFRSVSDTSGKPNPIRGAARCVTNSPGSRAPRATDAAADRGYRFSPSPRLQQSVR